MSTHSVCFHPSPGAIYKGRFCTLPKRSCRSSPLGKRTSKAFPPPKGINSSTQFRRGLKKPVVRIYYGRWDISFKPNPPPQNSHIQWKKNHLKMYLPFRMVMVHCHVSLLESIPSDKCEESSYTWNTKMLWFLSILALLHVLGSIPIPEESCFWMVIHQYTWEGLHASAATGKTFVLFLGSTLYPQL